MVVGATGNARLGVARQGPRRSCATGRSDVHDFAWTAWASFREKTRRAPRASTIRCSYPAGLRRGRRARDRHRVVRPRVFRRALRPLPVPRSHDRAPAGGRRRSRRHGVPDAHHHGRHLVLAAVRARRRSGHHPRARPPVLLRPRRDRRADVAVSRRGAQLVRRSRQPGGACSAPARRFDFWDFAWGSTCSTARCRPSAAHNEPVAQPAQAFASGGDYGAARLRAHRDHPRNAFAASTARTTCMRALGRYTRRYRFEHPTRRAVRRHDARRAGRRRRRRTSMALSSTRAGSTTSWPTPRRCATSRRRAFSIANGKRETVAAGTPSGSSWQGWALVMRHGTLHFPVDIELWGADGSVQLAQWDGDGDWIARPLQRHQPARRVIVDPDVKVTLDEDLFNNALARLAARNGRGARIERGTYAALLGLNVSCHDARASKRALRIGGARRRAATPSCVVRRCTCFTCASRRSRWPGRSRKLVADPLLAHPRGDRCCSSPGALYLTEALRLGRVATRPASREGSVVRRARWSLPGPLAARRASLFALAHERPSRRCATLIAAAGALLRPVLASCSASRWSALRFSAFLPLTIGGPARDRAPSSARRTRLATSPKRRFASARCSLRARIGVVHDLARAAPWSARTCRRSEPPMAGSTSSRAGPSSAVGGWAIRGARGPPARDGRGAPGVDARWASKRERRSSPVLALHQAVAFALVFLRADWLALRARRATTAQSSSSTRSER